jgi:hypothetical protein
VCLALYFHIKKITFLAHFFCGLPIKTAFRAGALSYYLTLGFFGFFLGVLPEFA